MEFKNYQLIDRTIDIVKAMLASDNNGTTDIRAHQIAETIEIIYQKLAELDGRTPTMEKVAKETVKTINKTEKKEIANVNKNN